MADDDSAQSIKKNIAPTDPCGASVDGGVAVPACCDKIAQMHPVDAIAESA
jgi:hypothetical protein